MLTNSYPSSVWSWMCGFVSLALVLSVQIEGIAPSDPLYNQSCKVREDTHLFVPTVLLERGSQRRTEWRDYRFEKLLLDLSAFSVL